MTDHLVRDRPTRRSPEDGAATIPAIGIDPSPLPAGELGPEAPTLPARLLERWRRRRSGPAAAAATADVTLDADPVSVVSEAPPADDAPSAPVPAAPVTVVPGAGEVSGATEADAPDAGGARPVPPEVLDPGATGPASAGDPPPAVDAQAAPRRLRIDPRIRQRRIAVKREEGRRRLRLLVAATAVPVALVVAFGLVRSPFFAVGHVRVSGTAHVSEAEVVQASGLLGRHQLVDVRGSAVAAGVERLPWVAGVVVARRWPSTVVIAVTERLPVAIVGGVGDRHLVDGQGRVLGSAPVDAPLPIISGDPSPPAVAPTGGSSAAPSAAAAVPGGAAAPGSVATTAVPSGTTVPSTGAAPTSAPAVSPPAAPAPAPAPVPSPVVLPAPGSPGSFLATAYRSGLVAATALPPALVARVSAVLVEPDGSVRLLLVGGATARIGPPRDLALKMEAVLTILTQVKVGSGTIDVTVPSAPVLVGGPGA